MRLSKGIPERTVSSCSCGWRPHSGERGRQGTGSPLQEAFVPGSDQNKWSGPTPPRSLPESQIPGAPPPHTFWGLAADSGEGARRAGAPPRRNVREPVAPLGGAAAEKGEEGCTGSQALGLSLRLQPDSAAPLPDAPPGRGREAAASQPARAQVLSCEVLPAEEGLRPRSRTENAAGIGPAGSGSP